MSTRLLVRPRPTARANPYRTLAFGATTGPVLLTLHQET
ncbi:hypothetical protein GA0070606_0359 [Micromonospora citrea]|uniref:Uncharacterized protein n=1 Tax=Micromonospora citrea TaxID=47855 RepID=A0A1C6TRZ7_9ACTN|nr:hypothetical protein GA0070606_0359 [Micromonospora citrea]